MTLKAEGRPPFQAGDGTGQNRALMSWCGPSLLTLDECAARLKVCRRTMCTLAQTGKVRTVRIGRSVRFDPIDLEEFIRSVKR